MVPTPSVLWSTETVFPVLKYSSFHNRDVSSCATYCTVVEKKVVTIATAERSTRNDAWQVVQAFGAVYDGQ